LNDLPNALPQGGKQVIYADDASVLLTARNDEELKTKISCTLDYMRGWFSANGLALNMEKTNIMKFTSSYHQNEPFQIIYQKKIIIRINNTKFLGLELDKNISWKNHVQKSLPKLSSACYLVPRMYPCYKSSTLKMIYFAFFYAVVEYVIIFWEDSIESKRILQQQKRIIRIMMGSTSSISCRTLF
jgi:hypothetical protein